MAGGENASTGVRVCEVVSGDLWAGAEVMAATLIPRLQGRNGLNVRTVLFNEGTLARRLRDWGLGVEVFDEAALGSLRLVGRLRSFFREFQPQVIHSHGYKEQITATLAASKVPHVRTLHGLPEPHVGWASIKMRVYRGLEKWAIHRRTRYLVYVSQESMERLKKTGRAEKVLIHNGIDLGEIPANPDRPALRRELRLSKGIPLIGAVGRLVPVKNLSSLLTAALILGGKDKRVHVVIVGDGPERMALQKKRDGLGLTRRVVFLGHRHDIHQVIAGLDVLVMPSLHEGLPMTLLEAMALGVPVVASRVGGIVEALGEMAEACTVPSNDSASLAAKIWELLSNPTLREQYADWGIKRVREAFTAEKMAEDYAKLLFKAATQPPLIRGAE